MGAVLGSMSYSHSSELAAWRTGVVLHLLLGNESIVPDAKHFMARKASGMDLSPGLPIRTSQHVGLSSLLGHCHLGWAIGAPHPGRDASMCLRHQAHLRRLARSLSLQLHIGLRRAKLPLIDSRMLLTCCRGTATKERHCQSSKASARSLSLSLSLSLFAACR